MRTITELADAVRTAGGAGLSMSQSHDGWHLSAEDEDLVRVEIIHRDLITACYALVEVLGKRKAGAA